MPRMSTKRFDYAKGIYYFNIKNGFNSNITIKRMKKDEAITTFQSYQRKKKNCEWLGKWDGKKFIEDNLEKLIEN